MARVSFELPEYAERRLRRAALRCGLSLAGYLLQRIAKHASADAERAMPPSHSFGEVLASVREGFAECGMNDEELRELFEQAREEAWQARAEREGASQK